MSPQIVRLVPVFIFAIVFLTSFIPGTANAKISKTTLHDVTVTCAVCGNEQTVTVIGSTNELGYGDLDCRPGEMLRSTMVHWVDRCDECGFCWDDLSSAPKDIDEILESEIYLDQLDNPDYPPLANEFLCESLIEEELEMYPEAAWSAIHAAWACDDEENECAVDCRLRAIDMIVIVMLDGLKLVDEHGADRLILTDLYRRTDQFELALVISDVGKLEVVPGDMMYLLYQYEELLINSEDTDAHDVGEAREWMENEGLINPEKI